MAKFTHTSEIFNKAVRRQRISSLISRSAKEFKRLTQERMIKGPHTGRLYSRKRGPGFRRSHRASAVGQRPSPDTMTLVNAVTDRRTGEMSAEVFIAERINPDNGTAASTYAEILQNGLDRPIMSHADTYQAEYKLRQDAEAVIKTLI